MSTIDELLAEVAECNNLLVSRWNNQQDEDNYNTYIAGGSTGDVFLQRCIIWTNADGTFSRETVSIVAVDGAAYWDRLPRILWEVAAPGTFETKLQAGIANLLSQSDNVALRLEYVSTKNEFAYGWLYVLNANNKIEAHHKFAYMDGTTLKMREYVGEV